MRILFKILLSICVIFTIPSFAADINDQSTSDTSKNLTSANYSDQDQNERFSPECKNIAKACKSAGFGFGKRFQGKGFWFDCMKPVLMNQTVNNVNVDPNDITACRHYKVTKLQNELNELQQIDQGQPGQPGQQGQ